MLRSRPGPDKAASFLSLFKKLLVYEIFRKKIVNSFICFVRSSVSKGTTMGCTSALSVAPIVRLRLERRLGWEVS
jgi:hypothetical protein